MSKIYHRIFPKFLLITLLMCLMGINSGRAEIQLLKPDANGVVYISSEVQLQHFRNLVDDDSTGSIKKAVLTKDITLTVNWVPIGLAPVNPNAQFSNDLSRAFKLEFDGNGKTISGLKMSSCNGGYAGLFGYATSESWIHDLILKDVDIEIVGNNSLKGVGAVCGTSFGRISNCEVREGVLLNTINAEASYVGGVVGYAANVDNCKNSLSVTGNDVVGGIAGYAETISECSTLPEYLISESKIVGSVVGGVVGRARNVYNCHNQGILVEGKIYAGGVAGVSLETISGCTNSPSYGRVKLAITGSNDRYAAGGIVGYAEGRIHKCSSSVDVQADCDKETYVGGIVGIAKIRKMDICDVHRRTGSGLICIKGRRTGGLIGFLESSNDVEIENCLVKHCSIYGGNSSVAGYEGTENESHYYVGSIISSSKVTAKKVWQSDNQYAPETQSLDKLLTYNPDLKIENPSLDGCPGDEYMDCYVAWVFNDKVSNDSTIWLCGPVFRHSVDYVVSPFYFHGTDVVISVGYDKGTGHTLPFSQDNHNQYIVSNGDSSYCTKCGLVPLSADSCFHIYTQKDLEEFREIIENGNLKKYKRARLEDNITLEVENWTPIGYAPVNPNAQFSNDLSRAFKLEFDGNGKTISGLKMSSCNGGYAGLFGYATSGSWIHDLTLKDIDIEIVGNNSLKSVGAVCGTSFGRISNCEVREGVLLNTINAEASYVGGVVGYAANVDNCKNSLSVTGNDVVGGIAGYAETISECSTSHEYLISESEKLAGSVVGGVVGRARNVYNCHNQGILVEGKIYAGGVAGVSLETISGCNSSSYGRVKLAITGSNDRYAAGGIVGYAEGRIHKCSSSVDVQADCNKETYVGGIVGIAKIRKMDICDVYRRTGGVLIYIKGRRTGGLIGFLESSNDVEIENCLVKHCSIYGGNSSVAGYEGTENESHYYVGSIISSSKVTAKKVWQSDNQYAPETQSLDKLLTYNPNLKIENPSLDGCTDDKYMDCYVAWVFNDKVSNDSTIWICGPVLRQQYDIMIVYPYYEHGTDNVIGAGADSTKGHIRPDSKDNHKLYNLPVYGQEGKFNCSICNKISEYLPFHVTIASSSTNYAKVLTSGDFHYEGRKMAFEVEDRTSEQLSGFITITDAKGNKVEYEHTSGNRFGFTMPASDVTISVAYKKVACIQLEALTDASSVTLTSARNADDLKLYASANNGASYEEKVIGKTYKLNKGEKVLMLGENIYGLSAKQQYTTFVLTGKIAVHGSAKNLVNSDPAYKGTEVPSKYCFAGLFKNCSSLVAVDEDFLPATLLKDYCYTDMFAGCTNLTTAPNLPATSLVEFCYAGMFMHCTNLNTVSTHINEWPAFTSPSWLLDVAETGTFGNLGGIDESTITRSPSFVPVGWTILSTHKVTSKSADIVFSSGSSKYLPGTTVSFLFKNMEGYDMTITARTADGTSIPVAIENGKYTFIMPNADVTISMLKESTGCLTFKALTDGSTIKLYRNGLGLNIEYSLDNGLTWSTHSEKITLAANATVRFRGVNPNGFSKRATNAYFQMNGNIQHIAGNVMSLIDGVGLSKEIPSEYCFTSLFIKCSALTSVSANLLPATTLKKGCYQAMFANCTSLQVAPILPATTLVAYCYKQMFNGCSSLKTMNVAFSSWFDTSSPATDQWVDGVTTLFGTFYCPGDLPYQTGISYIPTSWSVKRKELKVTLSNDAVANNYVLPLTSDYNKDDVVEFELTENAKEAYVSVYTASGKVDFDTISNGKFSFVMPNANVTIDVSNCLVFVAQTDSSKIIIDNHNNTPNVECSIDYGKTWSTLTTVNVSKGQVVKVRGNNPDGFSKSTTDYSRLLLLGEWKAYGSVMSLIDGVGLTKEIPNDSCFSGLFSGANGARTTFALLKAPNLPATTLKSSCYQGMFLNCRNLTNAPALPATTLASECYRDMFSGCTKLVEAPALPATSMKPHCYRKMFSGCTSLTEAPNLPATTLSARCYREMFSGCTLLEKAPDLPALTADAECYYGMFSGCNNLKIAPLIAANNVRMSACNQMFLNCTSLEKAPLLNATALTSGCYKEMFKGCTNLSAVKVNFTEWGSNTTSWLSGVASNGVFECPKALELINGVSNIPEGWTIRKPFDVSVTEHAKDNYLETELATEYTSGDQVAVSVKDMLNGWEAKVLVTDADSNAVEVNKVGDLFVFTMPVSDVTIDVQYHYSTDTECSDPFVFNNDKISYTRAISGNHWGTLCLPYAFTESNCTNIKLFSVKSISNDGISLEQITNVEAGKPVIYYAASGNYLKVEAPASSVQVEDPTSEDCFKGTFQQQTISKEANKYFYLKGDKFYQGKDNFILKPFRACLFSEAASANGIKSFRIISDEDDVVEEAEEVLTSKQIEGYINFSGQHSADIKEGRPYIIKYNDGTYSKIIVK